MTFLELGIVIWDIVNTLVADRSFNLCKYENEKTTKL